MKPTPRPIRLLLEQGNSTQALMRQLKQQRQLLSLVKKSLPPSLARHCRDVRFSESVLTLFAESPVWASKLRYSAPQLLGDIRRSQPGIANITVRIFPQQTPAGKPPSRHMAVGSANAAASVADSANGIGDPALRHALSRLADALRRPGD